MSHTLMGVGISFAILVYFDCVSGHISHLPVAVSCQLR